ncbi:MAG: TMEM43 family protein [Caldilineaceae bacterium]
MSTTYREVTHTSYFRRILNSFVGALIGLLLFFGSFIVIWWNEGRTNLALVAAESIPVSAATVDGANQGKFLAVTGDLVATENVGDPPYLQPGPYLQLRREVEMFAWVEETKSTERTKVGGGSETVTEYSYVQKWTDAPNNSADFKQPEGHANPTLSIPKSILRAPGAQLGAYAIDLNQLTMPGGSELPLTPQNVGADAGGKVEGNYLFLGQGALNSPQIGDIRISYLALTSPAAVTVFGDQQGGQLTPHLYDKGSTFFRALAGDRNSAISQLQTEHTITTWVLRGVAFLMLWIGLMMVLNPLATLAGILPILESITGFVTGLVAFIVALVIWAVATLISVVLHNIWLALIAALLVVGVIVYLMRRRQANKLQPT